MKEKSAGCRICRHCQIYVTEDVIYFPQASECGLGISNQPAFTAFLTFNELNKIINGQNDNEKNYCLTTRWIIY